MCDYCVLYYCIVYCTAKKDNDGGKCTVDIVKDKVFSSFYNIAIVNA